MSLHFPFPGMLLPVPWDLIHIPETSPHPGWYNPCSVVGRCLWPNLMYLTLKQSEIIILSDLMLRIFILKGLTGVLHAQWSDFMSYLHFQWSVIYFAWTCLGSNFSLIFLLAVGGGGQRLIFKSCELFSLQSCFLRFSIFSIFTFSFRFSNFHMIFFLLYGSHRYKFQFCSLNFNVFHPQTLKMGCCLSMRTRST